MSDIIWYYHTFNAAGRYVGKFMIPDVELHGLVDGGMCGVYNGPCIRCNNMGDNCVYYAGNKEILLCDLCYENIESRYKNTIVHIETHVLRQKHRELDQKQWYHIGWQFDAREIRQFISVALSLRQSTISIDIVNYIMKQLLRSYAIY